MKNITTSVIALVGDTVYNVSEDERYVLRYTQRSGWELFSKHSAYMPNIFQQDGLLVMINGNIVNGGQK